MLRIWACPPRVLKIWVVAVEVLAYYKSTVRFVLWPVPPEDTKLRQSISDQGKETQLSPAPGKGFVMAKQQMTKPSREAARPHAAASTTVTSPSF